MKILQETLVILLGFLVTSLASTTKEDDCKKLSPGIRQYLASNNLTIPDDYCCIMNVGVYKLYTNLTTWNEARESCKKEGAHLAIINSRKEAELLRDMFTNSTLMKTPDFNKVRVLIGFHDMYRDGNFVTLFDDSLEKAGYNTWTTQWGGQPDNTHRGDGRVQNCGTLADDGGLDDIDCTWQHGFICEIPMTQESWHAVSRSLQKFALWQYIVSLYYSI
ncbi:hypothetical protein QAD02_016993 [Eretmocerus hayati]|uniref:Uncharacterized protein n=1 Tax=Eretmocerus hayati TaxID=131215 RepID=A0ACC2PEG8_9HYME|nr:hypothetical protein QAD02_016993 [Eretmocerus hayati]